MPRVDTAKRTGNLVYKTISSLGVKTDQFDEINLETKLASSLSFVDVLHYRGPIIL